MGKLKTLVLLVVLCGSPAQAFDDLQHQWTLDILYHYTRIERSTLFNTDSFLSRQGAMLQFEYEEQIDLFWRWYAGGDLTFARYESSANTSFSPRDRFPWQLYIGTGFQLGTLKNFEILFGLGGSSEHFFLADGSGAFNFEQKISARGHLGFSWRFLSVVGSSARFFFRYSAPLTSLDHGGTPLQYAGMLDGTLRFRSRYDSSWSLYGGIRFEDYNTTTESVTYFTSRVYAGLGLHF
ncbi:MAG: hypothetical protein AAF203_11185 [Pseudomonadota bacterium]